MAEESAGGAADQIQYSLIVDLLKLLGRIEVGHFGGGDALEDSLDAR